MHFKALKELFSPGGCSRRLDTDKLLNSLMIPNRYSRNTSYPQRATRWQHMVGARKGTKIFRYVHPSAADTKAMEKQIKKNPKNNNKTTNKKSTQTRNKQKKYTEEGVSRPMPDALF